MFGTKVIRDAIIHAKAVHPQESCGLVIDNHYRQYANVADDPEEDFRISSQDYAGAMRVGAIQAVIHSHSKGQQARPSEHDMVQQMISKLPWCIIPLGDKPFWFGDQCPIPKLVGRSFRFGVTDCYSLIRDWYRLEQGITLADYPRRSNWYQTGQNHYLEKFAEVGFVLIPKTEAEPGDVFLLQVAGSPVPNHAALYLGNSLILHHFYNRLSNRPPVSVWWNYITHTLRYTR